MNFGSSFVYHSDSDGEEDAHDHCETIGEQELGSSVLVSLGSESAPTPTPPPPPPGFRTDFGNASSRASSAGPPRPAASSSCRGKVYRQRVDVNVVQIGMTDLRNEPNFSTGEPIECGNCGVFFSHLSNLEGANQKPSDKNSHSMSNSVSSAHAFQDISIWKCEFCLHSNAIDTPEEIPDKAHTTLDYIITPPPMNESGAASKGAANLGVVIPCVDISGSMCISSEVEGNAHIRGDAASRLATLRIGGDPADQYLPNETKGISYVSRLQCVQGAISSLIEDLKEENTEMRVGLVTFSDKVSIHGDASGQPFVVSGSALDDYEQMVEIGKTNKRLSAQSATISATAAKLSERLFALEEGGPTGLGPAVVAAISQAAEFNRTTNTTNAKVVLATDGLANIGVGSLENNDSETVDNAMKTDEFYSMVGNWASASGVTVDVFGIEGDTCDIENLSTLADCTGGSVHLVNPINLLTDFEDMTSQKIATDVSVKVYLHSGVEFRGEDEHLCHQNENISHLDKQVGIVTEDSGAVTFEFNVKSRSDLKKMNLGHLQSLPFQVHISYTNNNGMRCLRVISDQKSVTRTRDVAEKNADVSLLTGHVQSRCAEYARKGHYTKSRVSARAWGNVFNRAMTHQQSASPQIRRQTAMQLQELNDVDGLIGETVQAEMCSGDYMSSDDEMDETVKTRQFFKRKQKRSKNDSLSSKLYSMSKSKK